MVSFRITSFKELTKVFAPCIICIIVFHTKMFVHLFETGHLVSHGMAIEGYRFWTGKSFDVLECAKLCLKRRPCLSFNFDVRSSVCELNDDVHSSDKTIKQGNNWVYSEISSWPSQIDPDCFARPCADDEVCISGGLAQGSCCSYTCIKLYQRCPLPEGVVSHGSRSVGTTLDVSCRPGYKLNGTNEITVCMENLEWNTTLESSCTPIHGSSCEQDVECDVIQGSCLNNTCTCDDGLVYDDVIASCKNVSVCPGDWLVFESSCYLLGTDDLHYTEARELCLEFGGSLVQVDTIEERQFLYDSMAAAQPQTDFGYWNDLYEVTVNGEERWRETNDPLDPTDWAPGQQEDSGGPQKCTIFYRAAQYKWADIECEERASRKARALCEKSLLTH